MKIGTSSKLGLASVAVLTASLLVAVAREVKKTGKASPSVGAPPRRFTTAVDPERWCNDNPQMNRALPNFRAPTSQEVDKARKKQAMERDELLRLTSEGRRLRIKLMPGHSLPLTAWKEGVESQGE